MTSSASVRLLAIKILGSSRNSETLLLELPPVGFSASDLESLLRQECGGPCLLWEAESGAIVQSRDAPFYCLPANCNAAATAETRALLHAGDADALLDQLAATHQEDEVNHLAATHVSKL